MEFRGVYKCNKCGNVVEVLDASKPPVVCCGEKMEKLVAQTEDATNEKHVPVVNESDNGVEVVVGTTLHPMTEKHQIVFIEVITKDDLVLRADLNPDDEPKVEFPVKKSDIEEVREYCNIHGLWKA